MIPEKRTLRDNRTPDPKGRPHTERIDASVEPDGSVVITGVFQGEQVEEWFGDWDHEFGLTIPADKVPLALVEILALLFSPEHRLEYSDLRKRLDENGLASNVWVWT